MISVNQNVQMALAGAFAKQVLPAMALVIRFLMMVIAYIDIAKVCIFHNINYNMKTAISFFGNN